MADDFTLLRLNAKRLTLDENITHKEKTSLRRRDYNKKKSTLPVWQEENMQSLLMPRQAQMVTALRLEVVAHRVLVPSAAFEIPVEANVHVEDLPNVLHAERFALIDRESLRRAHSVLDLPSIKIVLRQGRVVVFTKRHQIDILEGPNPLNENLEHRPLGLQV